MIKRFVTHSLVYGFASQVPKLAGVIALPFITRDLTEFDYGVYGIVIAYSAAIEILVTLGLRVSLMNVFYRAGLRFRIYWSHMYLFMILWSIPYILGHVFVIYWVLPDEIHNPWLIAWLSAGTAFFFGPISVMGSLYYQLKEEAFVVGMITSLSGLLTVVLNVVFISHLKLGSLGWFWSSFVSGAAVFMAYGGLMTFRVKLLPALHINWKFITRSLSVSLPTVPHFYSIFLLNSSDRVIMRQLGTPTDSIGKYNVAYTVGNIFQSAAMATGFAITPLMMRCYREGNEEVARRLVFFLQGSFLLSTFLACTWMREIFQVLIKNEALNTMYYLGIIIVMSFNYRPIYYGAVNKLIFLEKTKILWQLTFVPGVINVAANVMFIPVFGYEFAAYSTFATFSLMGVLGYFSKSYRAASPLPYYPLAWLAFNVMLTAVAYTLRDTDWLIKSSLSFITMIIVAITAMKFFNLRNRLSRLSSNEVV